LDDIEYHEDSEVAKNINAWRQSDRRVMIDTVQDLIRMSHKYAKSQYTPSNQRARWAKLAGQLIWYQDQIMKNFSLEAMYIELQDVKKRVIESNERRERQSRNRNYPLIGLRKPVDRKGEVTEDTEKAHDEECSEAVEADDSGSSKETVSDPAE
jgi:hypothetical protein